VARNDAPPFDRGQYETNEDMSLLAGREYMFEDLNYAQTQGAKAQRSGRLNRVRLVQNGSGVAILPKQLCQFSTTPGAINYGCVVSGYVNTTNGRGYPADEFLPAAGVPAGAYFFIVTKGAALCRLPNQTADYGGTNVAVGGVLVGVTSAASTGVTAGRVAPQSVTASNDAAENYVGRALSAATTGQTDQDVLVDVGKW